MVAPDESPQTSPSSATSKTGASSKNGNKMLLIILIVIVALGGGAAAFFFLKNSKNTTTNKKEEEINLLDITFLTLPEIITNLKPSKDREAILKATFILELEKSKDKEEVDRLKPMIIDQFQTYLRQLEVVDLQGGEGLERLRQELTNRVANLVAPIKIRQVLFKEFLVQ